MMVIQVAGMKCQHCSSSVTKVLESFEGLSNCHVDLEKGEVSFEGQADIQAVKKAIEDKGFKCSD